jgi:hypothetical protein
MSVRQSWGFVAPLVPVTDPFVEDVLGVPSGVPKLTNEITLGEIWYW